MTHTTQTPILETLKRARKLIAEPDKHTVRALARTENGESVDPCDPNATRFCALGALHYAAIKMTGTDCFYVRKWPPPETKRLPKGDVSAYKLRQKALGEICVTLEKEYDGISLDEANDENQDPTKTRHEIVLDVYDTTIARLETENA